MDLIAMDLKAIWEMSGKVSFGHPPHGLRERPPPPSMVCLLNRDPKNQRVKFTGASRDADKGPNNARSNRI
jgi:hypothetical protein